MLATHTIQPATPRRRRPQPPPDPEPTHLDAAGAVPLTLPLAFEAFRDLHYDCYLGYARLHLPGDDAAEAVARTLGHLVIHWPYVISRRSPAAYAWDRLVDHTRSRHHPLDLNTDSTTQYDAVVLHHGLGCSVPTVAATTGLHPAKAAYLLRVWQPST
ncbi:hypothetical protein [Streptomyces sp. NPDC046853]|uniref:hypothetical protein n=1 Tax=unclassified Streptomyces TaxID=2593676 RepID=UPI0033DF0AB1